MCHVTLTVPGPCDPDDLLDGVVFGAKYLGSTQLKSEKNPSTNARMAQAQEAVDRIKVESDIRQQANLSANLLVSASLSYHSSEEFYFFLIIGIMGSGRQDVDTYALSV